MLNSRSIFFYSLKAVAACIASPDHESDGEKGRDGISHYKFQGGHPHNPGDNKYLCPESNKMPAEQYNENASSVKFILEH